MNKVTIDTLEILNVRGIDKLTFPLASLTLFTGGNAEGKSSALDAFRCIFDGKFSHDPSLIRRGEKVATVKAVLSDGTKITRRMTPKKSSLLIRRADDGKVEREAEFVAKLATGFAFDPLAFLAMKKQEQNTEFLRVINPMFQPEELAGITAQVQPIGLERLNSIRAGMYEDRTKENVAAKNLDGEVAGIEKGIPPDSDEDWAAERDRLAGVVASSRQLLINAGNESNTERSNRAGALNAEANQKIQAIKDRLRDDLDALEDELVQALDERTTSLRADLELATTQHATAREKAESATMARALKAQLKKAIDKRGDAVEKAENLTKRIKKLDAVKLEKLKTLPIPGTDFVDGEIYIDGGPLRQLNWSDQVLIAIQLAKLAGGDLGFMVSDYFTEVDEDRIWELAELLPKAGLQLAAAFRIRGEDLKVRPIRTPEDIAELKAAIRESVSEQAVDAV